MILPAVGKEWTMRDRVLAVMDGRLPDRLPFIDRIEIWYKGMQARETMPRAYEGMSLNQVHKAVGIGRQKFSIPYALRVLKQCKCLFPLLIAV